MLTSLFRACVCACACACTLLVNAELTPTGSKTVVLDAAYSARENLIDSNWQFSKDESTWESISIPHDFSIKGPFGGGEDESGHLPGGTGYYKRSFKLAASTAGKRIVVDFDGVYQHATVKVNNTTIGENHYGYNNFAFDITSAVHCDGVSENVLEVEASQTLATSRWYPGTGIERDVKIFVLPATHLVTDGIFITTPGISNGVNTVRTSVEMKNESSSAANLKARVTVYAYGSSESLGTATSAASAVAAGAMVMTSVDVTPASVSLWSPENPNRYQAKVELLDADNDDAVIDTQYETFGFRYFTRDPQYGLKLNGNWYKLYGSDLHHDLGAFGAAYNDGLWRKRLLQLKDMGVNAIRTGHNPYPKKFMALCDELGFLVLDEFFDGWYVQKNTNGRGFNQYFETVREDGRTWAQFVIDQTVRRDRNCPSVLAWDIGDEVSEGNGAEFRNDPVKAAQVATNLCNWVLENDTTRPITYGDNRYNGETATANINAALYGAGGWIGINYPCGGNNWMGPAGAQKGGVDTLKNLYGSFLATESSSSVASRGRYMYEDYTKPTAGDDAYHLTSYDVAMPSWGSSARGALRYSLMNDFVIGEFLWTGFDYIGEPTPWNGTGSSIISGAQANFPNSSYFGRIDTCGFEKDNYYLYRANWKKDGHTLHLVGGWTSDNQAMDNGKAVVYVYSDAPKYTLYLGSDPIAHAVREDHTSPNTGHTYYTYTVTVDDADKCVNGTATGDHTEYAQLTPRFLVSMTGTLTVRAFDGEDHEIGETVGRKILATPNATKHLVVEADEDSVVASDENIVRFVIDVLDSADVPVLMGSPLINLTIEGNGEIVGVDNGDPGTDLKYQVATVLAAGGKSATVKAYAGKALVLVKAVGSGRVTLNATSEGIAGSSDFFIATAKVVAPEVGVACTFNSAYSTPVGDPLDLPVVAEGGTIEWTTVPSAEDLLVPGSYTCQGVLSSPGCLSVPVSASVTVVQPAAEEDDGSVVALRNVALVMPIGGNVADYLPAQVWGLTAAAHTNGLFTVEWNQSDINAFNSSAVTTNVIHGTASSKSVTATVRTIKGKGGSGDFENLADSASDSSVTYAVAGATQDAPPNVDASKLRTSVPRALDMPNIYPDSIISRCFTKNGIYYVTNTVEWTDSVDVSLIKLYYATSGGSCQTPQNVNFYADDFDTLIPIDSMETTHHPDQSNPDPKWGMDKMRCNEYTLSPAVSMHKLIAVYEVGNSELDAIFSIYRLWAYRACTGIGTADPETNVRLGSLEVDENPVEEFVPATLNYEVQGGSIITAAGSDSNIGITILPKFADTKKGYVVTLAEDGESSLTYSVALTDPCLHESITTNAEVSATCLQDGLTEQWKCDVCHKILKHSAVIPATGHLHFFTNATVQATCTAPGHYGSVVCSDCSAIIENEVVIPALGHNYIGVIDPYPTYESTGLETFTCSRCSDQYQEVLPVLLPVVALRNVAAVMTTSQNATDVLPEQVAGLSADGEASGSFSVTWNTEGLTFAADTIVQVPGTATVNVGVMGVTGSVRVVSASSGVVNYSTMADEYGFSCTNGGANKSNVDKAIDGNDHGNNVWGNPLDLIAECKNSGAIIYVTNKWNTARTISKIRVCCLSGSWCKFPDVVEFYSDASCESQYKIPTDNGVQEEPRTASSNEEGVWCEYKLDSPVPLTTLVGKFRTTDSKLVVVRFWALGGGSSNDPFSDSVISELSVDGTPVAGFSSSVDAYTVTNGTAITGAAANKNTGITILPRYGETTNAYVITAAEDNEHFGKYSVYMPEGCHHLHTTTNAGYAATCLTDGLTAKITCNDCSEVLQAAEVIVAPGSHAWGDWEIDDPATPSAPGSKHRECSRCHEIENAEIPQLAEVFALRNVATVIQEGDDVAAALTNKIAGLDAKGDVVGWYDVVWNTSGLSFTDGMVVAVPGSATVNEESMVVTGSVRVVAAPSGGVPEMISGSATISTTAAFSNTYRIKQADAPAGNDTGWTNYGATGRDNYTVTCGWTKSYDFTSVDIIYTVVHKGDGNTCELPTAIKFCSDAGLTQPISFEAGTPYVYDDFTRIKYTLSPSASFDHLYIGITTPGDGIAYVDICRLWVNVGEGEPGGDKTPLTDDKLSDIKVDGVSVENFVSDTTEYEVGNGNAITAATAANNMGITILPKNGDTTNAYVVTVAENCFATSKYQVYMPVTCVHDPIEIPAVPASCTNTGWTAGVKCSICDHIITAPAQVDMLPHTWQEEPHYLAPTFDADGHTAGTNCAVCGFVLTSSEPIPHYLHIAALRNVATVIAEGDDAETALTNKVAGLSADGEILAWYDVSWNKGGLPFVKDTTVNVPGSAEVNGEPMYVTGSVRVVTASSGGSLTNVAYKIVPECDCHGNGGSHYSLAKRQVLTDGVPDSGSWDTWLRYGSGPYVWSNETYTLSFDLGTTRTIHSLRMYYWNEGQRPSAYVAVRTSSDNVKWTALSKLTGVRVEGNVYDFDLPSDRSGVRYIQIKIGANSDGSESVADGANYTKLYELEIYGVEGGVAGDTTPHASKDLGALAVDGVAVDGFTPTGYEYSVKGGKAVTAATAADNMGITILPKANGAAHVVTVAEDCFSTSTYTVSMPANSGFVIIVR